ncbi:MAG: succinylglutamate desuccinylase/aspartoacylase family protein [Gammaproteobacteria bacterium]
MPDPLVIQRRSVVPGSRVTLELPLAQLYTHTPLTLPVHVVRGRKDGPRLFVSAAIHGDELNGVEVIRRLLRHSSIRRLRGTLLAIPIVNVYGVIQHSRYLPDRRDLNRAFPGLEGGSLAARLAHLFMSEIVEKCTHGIDLHTGAIHRNNLPQIRANMEDETTARLARAFGVPVVINADVRDGSLREAAAEHGVHMLVYEAGEALRFDELSIRAGVRGIINVMRELGMLARRRRPAASEPFVARTSAWVRAPLSGILRAIVPLGARIKRHDVMGYIADPFGEAEVEVKAPAGGIVIGRTNIPLVHEGEALFHVARFEDVKGVAQQVESFQTEQTDALFLVGDPPIV